MTNVVLDYSMIHLFERAIESAKALQKEKEEDLFHAVHDLISKSFWHRVLFFYPCNDKAEDSFRLLLDDVDFEKLSDDARKNCIERAFYYSMLNNICVNERRDIIDLEKEIRNYETIMFALKGKLTVNMTLSEFDLFKFRFENKD